MRRRRYPAQPPAPQVEPGFQPPAQPVPSPAPYLKRGSGNRSPGPADIAATLRRKERRLRVFQLKALGHTDQEIGKAVGVTEKIVRSDYRRAADEYGVESAEHHKARANDRFDRQMRVIAASIERTRVALQDAVSEITRLASGSKVGAEFRARATARIASLSLMAERTIAHAVGKQTAITEKQALLNGVAFRVEVAGRVDHAVAVAVTTVPIEDVLARGDANRRAVVEARAAAGLPEASQVLQ